MRRIAFGSSGLESVLADAIARPSVVVRSSTDGTVLLYYRDTITQSFGTKWFCVVIKHSADDAFVVTAYLTDKVKAGETLWTRP